MGYFFTYLSLGSNLGDRLENLIQALKRIKEEGNLIIRVSSVYETRPLGKTNQPDFLNLVAEVKTKLSPFLFLALLQRIENEMGRVRKEKWGPRIIDIDLIFYEDLEIESPELTLPHPLFKERAFVLIPLMEVLPKIPPGFQARAFKKGFEAGVILYPVDKETRRRIKNLEERG